MQNSLSSDRFKITFKSNDIQCAGFSKESVHPLQLKLVRVKYFKNVLRHPPKSIILQKTNCL